MENIIKYTSKPIDIISNSNFKTSYNTSLENNVHIRPSSMNNLNKLNKEKNISYNMKKSLSLDSFWPNTPPSFSPNKNILKNLSKLLNKYFIK